MLRQLTRVARSESAGRLGLPSFIVSKSAVVFLLLVACCFALAVPAAWAQTSSEKERAPEADLRQAMSRLYIHGVTRDLALAEVGEEAVPRLRTLLFDKSFPRRDNVVLFLAQLDRSGRVAADFRRLLENPPGSWDVPEEDAALLLAVEGMGILASRGDDDALATLMRWTAGIEADDELRLAASRGKDPAALRADLLEAAMRGLAWTGDATARRRLSAIARGHVLLSNARDLRPAAEIHLGRFDEILAPISSVVPDGNSPQVKGTSDDRTATRNGDPAAGEPDVTLGGGIFDTQPSVHDNGITWANHVDIPSKMSNGRLDDVLDNGNLRAGRADYNEDVACCITLSRSGGDKVFGVSGDGLDTIDDGSELSTALNDPVSRVKVVRTISWCGGPGFGIAGCAQTPGDGICVRKYSSLTTEAILWIHEYGHNTGLPHANDSRRLMYGTINGGNNGLDQGECNAYHSPSPWTNALLTNTGVCSDGDGDEVQDGIDNCPAVANTNQSDSDGDAIGNACDNCANDSNPDQLDTDSDGLGNVCDVDDDGDGVEDAADCAPLDASVSEVAGESSNLAWTANSKTELTWVLGNQATESNVYRGDFAEVFDPNWACLAAGVLGTTYDDPQLPTAGAGFHYLVTGENSCGESGAGSDSNGAPRTPSACP